MAYRFSPLTTIPPSATLAMNALVQQKRAMGVFVHNLTIGEPIIQTPEVVIHAATEAMREGKTLYTPPAGIPELRSAAATWITKTYDAPYKSDETIVTCGGKFGLYLLLQSFIQPGDDVLIGAPYWVSYPAMVQLFGGRPVIAETAPEVWKITPEFLAPHVTAKTKLVLLNNGGNPTGVLYSRDEIRALLQFAKERSLIVVSDEVYSGLTYDGHEYVSAGSFPEYRESVVIVQSCSKHFAMTGWRVGFVFAPKEIIEVLTTLQGQSTSGTSSISQWAGFAAIQHAETLVQMVQREMEGRRDLFMETLSQHFKNVFSPPAAGLYAFISMKDLGVQSVDDVMFCKRTLEEGNIALVPGSAFGAPGYVRSSFGGQKDDIRSGIVALEKYLRA